MKPAGKRRPASYIFARGKTISEGPRPEMMDSLRNITGAEIYKTTDFISLSRDDALRMCSTASDCSLRVRPPVYAEVVSKMILKNGIR